MSDYDLLIVGAGPVGCVIAERAANERGWSSLVIDSRPHIAGNCYDRLHESGVLIHQYGPHYFRSNTQELLDYLSKFTDWIPGNYIVKASFKGELYPIPINLITLRKFFGRDFTPEEAAKHLEEIRHKIEAPANSEEFVLSRVGKELYEAFYLGYTLKQWSRHPRELDPSVCGRIPIRLNEDCRYVNVPFQVTPAKGFTHMFGRMLDHPKIKVQLNTDYREIRHTIQPKVATVYCGPLDTYFDFRFGKLPWRSLEFDFRPVEKEFVQDCVQINYPWDHDYTRTVEIKHVTKQKHPHTVISYEYPKDEGDPYYPIPSSASQALFEKYNELAKAETRDKKIYFVGRLANYKYINTDEAIESARSMFKRIVEETTLGKRPEAPGTTEARYR